ncbi:MAG: hypothetical protein GWO20_06800 [Candidatus Korarchaeota archaeon]|nr:hypothetical protein [Candidatus Korarchaeota archaeon]NIU83151.1 hypothetical protein [Candidatus Thorarchaeota archaeon]NIW13524.1 hypothetical protein [Candidatus Thorarchaeota archaeon]NIW51623.1 hypothetical protein [Candidatus Korarchaeota archaeon]
MIVEIILSILLVGTALLSLEVRSSIRAISSFAAMNLLVSLLLLYLKAAYVAVFQLLIYFGVSLFLLLVIIGLGETEKGKLNRRIILPGTLFGFLLTLFLVILSLTTPLISGTEYQQTTFTEISEMLWGTYGYVLLVAAYIVAFSVLGALSLISLKEGKK